MDTMEGIRTSKSTSCGTATEAFRTNLRDLTQMYTMMVYIEMMTCSCVVTSAADSRNRWWPRDEILDVTRIIDEIP